MGVDYGIYLLARVAEEKRNDPSITLEEALMRTIRSYSKSIIAIAGTLVIGLLVWTLSGLKFQAQMGLMLAVILFLNCLGAVFLVPGADTPVQAEISLEGGTSSGEIGAYFLYNSAKNFFTC